MAHRVIVTLVAVALIAAPGFAYAQGTSPSAPKQEPKIETLSTQHADPTDDKTVGESAKPQKNGEDGDLAAAVRIDEKMSKESEGGYRPRRGR